MVVCRIKAGRTISIKVDDVQMYAKRIEGQESLTIKQHLLDLDHDSNFIDCVLFGGYDVDDIIGRDD